MKGLSGWNYVTVMVLAAACWGLGTVLTKGILEHVPPLTLLVTQLVVSIAFLWTIVAIQGQGLLLNRDTFRFSLTGLLEPGLAYTFGLLGLALTTASMASLIWAVEPIIILGLAWLILGERLTRPLIGFSTIAIIGVFLLIGLTREGGDRAALMGNGLILIGVACCALYVILTRRIVSQVAPLTLTALQQSVALVWALLIWPIELWHSGVSSLATISPAVWLWAAASGVIYYALAFWFYITGLKKTPASLAGFFLNLVPIFGVAGAFIFLGERLNIVQWAGAILILAAAAGIMRHHSAEAVVSGQSPVGSGEW